MQQTLAMQSNLLSLVLDSMQLLSQPRTNAGWPTFEELWQRLHAQGIYIHPEQLAEFLLAHGLPVHLRYVPAHLQLKAVAVNKNYQGDMVRLIEELEPPCWDFSWMENLQIHSLQNGQSNKSYAVEQQEQPTWDYSWLK